MERRPQRRTGYEKAEHTASPESRAEASKGSLRCLQNGDCIADAGRAVPGASARQPGARFVEQGAGIVFGLEGPTARALCDVESAARAARQWVKPAGGPGHPGIGVRERTTGRTDRRLAERVPDPVLGDVGGIRASAKTSSHRPDRGRGLRVDRSQSRHSVIRGLRRAGVLIVPVHASGTGHSR